MKKTAIWVMIFIGFFIGIRNCNAEIITSGKWSYEVLDDFTARLVFYTADDAEVTVPEVIDGYPVSTLGYGVFSNCSELVSLTIPAGITVIEESVFLPCGNLSRIRVSPDNSRYSVIENVLFDKKTKAMVHYPAGLTQECYSIPEGVKTISRLAFYFNENLTAVVLPKSLKVIEETAFYGCRNLESITLSGGIKSIAPHAFQRIGLFAEFIVEKGSYAMEWAVSEGMNYKYSDSEKWLNEKEGVSGWLASTGDEISGWVSDRGTDIRNWWEETTPQIKGWTEETGRNVKTWAELHRQELEEIAIDFGIELVLTFLYENCPEVVSELSGFLSSSQGITILDLAFSY